VGLFRRKEPLHRRLAREGGLLPPERRDEPLDPRPPLLEAGIHGLQRPRDWDVTLTADAEGIDADEARFVALPDGTLLVEPSAEGGVFRPGAGGFAAGASSPADNALLAPLAAAVEAELPPPYRARAVRRGERLWAVQARRIEVLALPDSADADTLDVTRTAEATELRVDGERAFGSVRELEERGAREGREFAVHAERLDGDLWEVRASAL
jgi:hypothetical protein